MDYDLSRLSWRSFEQLIQALAVRHFGTGVVVFGDGPDGGREAMCDGRTGYSPLGAEPWEGYTVIQAKFRQRPLGARLDGPWAVQALAGELQKFSERAGGRPRPTNYVFATNVDLSAGTGGAKDKAAAALEGARDGWGLGGYDIWDYPKLRAFLDTDEEVRTTFGWITAGDVLASVLRRLEDSTSEFERTIVNYLEKSIVSDRFVRLEEAGHSAEEPLSLSRVFVDLPVEGAGPEERRSFLSDLLERTAVLARDREPDAPDGPGRVVLVGGPGQGKTTLGQFACQVFRAGLLSSVAQRPLSAEGSEAVGSITSACKELGLAVTRAPRFPVRVVLTELAEALSEREQPLLAWVAGSISRRVGSTISTELFRRWLGAYPWFLVLDGLDEVPAGAGRDRVMRCVEEFWVDAAHARADVFVLATTRPQGYNDEFSKARYNHERLADLTPEGALDYGSRLARARYGDGEQTATVVSRLGRALQNDMTLHLMRSPLQVAIMTALVDRFGQPPHERWSLFHRYYEVIYQRERERDTVAAPILSEHQPDIDAIHQRVGLALQVLTTRDGHSDPFLTGAQLTRIVDARLGEEGHARDETKAMAERIRAAAELRLVFLVGAEQDRIGFEIRSLQEFMAAGALVDGPDAQVLGRLRAIAPLPHWRNVLLFAVGECYVRKQWLREPLQNLCRSLDVDAGDPLLGPMKAGARLALDLLADQVARHQPGPRRVIAAHALVALDVALPGLSLQLAGCYDDALGDLYREKLADLLGAADEIRRTNARRCLAALGARGVRWASQMLEGAPPADAAEALPMLDELPREIFDALDPAYAGRCIAMLDHQALRSLVRGGCLERLLPELRWIESARTSSVNIELGNGVAFAITGLAAGVELHKSRWDATLAGAIAPSPTLAVYRASNAFSRELHADGLARAMTSIAETSTVDAWQSCAFTVPWPLGMHLARATSRRELEHSAAEVLAGCIGDRDTWEQAEQRWKDDGVELAIDALEGAPSFPLEVARIKWFIVDRAIAFPLLDELRTLRVAGHPGARNLARDMLTITVHGEDGPLLGPPEIAELLDAVVDVDVNVLGAVRASEGDLSKLPSPRCAPRLVSCWAPLARSLPGPWSGSWPKCGRIAHHGRSKRSPLPSRAARSCPRGLYG